MEFKYDKTDIHLCYNESRKLPEETIKLWLETISKYVAIDLINMIIDLVVHRINYLCYNLTQ